MRINRAREAETLAALIDLPRNGQGAMRPQSLGRHRLLRRQGLQIAPERLQLGIRHMVQRRESHPLALTGADA